MVHETLGASPRFLGRLYTEGPELVIADLVHTAARHLDHVHEQFTAAAQNAASVLTRAAAGNTSINSLGVLQNRGTQIDILAARRDDAVDRLKETIDAYRQVTASEDAAPVMFFAVLQEGRWPPARHDCVPCRRNDLGWCHRARGVRRRR
ncbi:hypothetical protein NKH18_48325 [Streptomyces sp. M10(2022)]